MKNGSSIATLLFVVVVVIGFGIAYSFNGDLSSNSSMTIEVVFILIGSIIAWSTKVANQWSRAVVLRLGKY